ncbi:AmpC Beta-lactamase class C and other penicillin binding proteins [Caulobacteraceae bacterium]
MTASFELHGACHESFLPIREALVSNFENGREIGASVAVIWRGELVVDLWGGSADRAGTRPWERDTIVQVFSTGKIMLVLCMMMLVDRGKLDLDAPVARYWPEFGQGNKDRVTVRQALTHQAGVPGFRPPATFEDLHDWKAITARIAAMPHWFGGETTLCYHPVTYGFLLGEILRRVDGRDIATFAREEVTSRIGADFQLGPINPADISRVAEPKFLLPAPDHQYPGGLTGSIMDSVGLGDWTSPGRLSALIPASNCYANGRSIARICSVFAGEGAVDGIRLLSPHWARETGREQVSGEDLALGPIRYGMGMGIDNRDFPAPGPNAFHWGGYGGSWGLMDPDSQVAFGYAPNTLDFGGGTISPRLAGFHQALMDILPGLT